MVLNSSVMNLLTLPKSINLHTKQAAFISPINKEAKWAARSVKFLLEKEPLHWHMRPPQHIYWGGESQHQSNTETHTQPSFQPWQQVQIKPVCTRGTIVGVAPIWHLYETEAVCGAFTPQESTSASNVR